MSTLEKKDSKISLSEAKEKLERTVELLEKYLDEVPEALVALLRLRVVKLEGRISSFEGHPDDPQYGLNPVAVAKEAEEIRRTLTMARYDTIHKKVYDLDMKWRSAPYGHLYSGIRLAGQAAEWLSNRPKVDLAQPKKTTTISEIVEIIEMGKAIHLQLGSPWGRCRCGRTLTPIENRDGGYSVYQTCPSCHIRQKYGPQMVTLSSLS